MIDISSKKTIHIFAVCTIFLWLSYLIYLPPFVPVPNVKELVDNSYQMYSLNNPVVSKQTLEKKLLSSIYFAYAKAFIFILVGIISGILIYKQKRLGRILAIFLCLVMLAGRAFALFREYPNITERLYALYVFLLSQRPLPIIHRDIIAPIFFIFSIIFLFNRTVSGKFN